MILEQKHYWGLSLLFIGLGLWQAATAFDFFSPERFLAAALDSIPAAISIVVGITGYYKYRPGRENK